MVCVASGPSLTEDDVRYCEGRATVIAVNDAVRYATFAAALVASDRQWWEAHRGVPWFTGLKYCLEPAAVGRWPDVLVPRKSGHEGIEFDPMALRTGRNSGGAAIGIAVHFGAARILLLGYDCGPDKKGREHFWPERGGKHAPGLRNGSPYSVFKQTFQTMVQPLKAAGISVVNCSRETHLQCWPRADLRVALSGKAVAA